MCFHVCKAVISRASNVKVYFIKLTLRSPTHVWKYNIFDCFLWPNKLHNLQNCSTGCPHSAFHSCQGFIHQFLMLDYLYWPTGSVWKTVKSKTKGFYNPRKRPRPPCQAFNPSPLLPPSSFLMFEAPVTMTTKE